MTGSGPTPLRRWFASISNTGIMEAQTGTMADEGAVDKRRAIEALRAGVPNRDAVRYLGSSQPAIEDRFRGQLAGVKEGIDRETSVPGLLVAGDFGSGKSHLLEYFQHVALEENFVCSKVVISKETPLYDPAKVYQAAMQSAKVPGRKGPALPEIALKLGATFNSPEYAEFFDWLNGPDNGLNSRFAATMFVFQHARSAPEVQDQIIRFWAGSRLAVADVRRWLRDSGEAVTYRIDQVPAKMLALQRYSFAPRLMVAAGFSGWVILIDEVELIGRYSLPQRARSYAELARWMGKLEGEETPRIAAVLAITAQFESAVLDERNDEETVPGRLRTRGGDESLLVATQAERGMRIIRRDRVRLDPPTSSTISAIHDLVRDLHAVAYEWDPPRGFTSGDRSHTIRQHVKRWINEWDLKRLYDHVPDTEIQDVRETYTENRDFETPPEETENDK